MTANAVKLREIYKDDLADAFVNECFISVDFFQFGENSYEHFLR
jgi:hypothetical protein